MYNNTSIDSMSGSQRKSLDHIKLYRIHGRGSFLGSKTMRYTISLSSLPFGCLDDLFLTNGDLALRNIP